MFAVRRDGLGEILPNGPSSLDCDDSAISRIDAVADDGRHRDDDYGGDNQLLPSRHVPLIYGPRCAFVSQKRPDSFEHASRKTKRNMIFALNFDVT
jgi:hypothetical protein